MQPATTFTIASVGCSIVGSGTSSKRMSPGAWIVVARMLRSCHVIVTGAVWRRCPPEPHPNGAPVRPPPSHDRKSRTATRAVARGRGPGDRARHPRRCPRPSSPPLAPLPSAPGQTLDVLVVGDSYSAGNGATGTTYGARRVLPQHHPLEREVRRRTARPGLLSEPGQPRLQRRGHRRRPHPAGDGHPVGADEPGTRRDDHGRGRRLPPGRRSRATPRHSPPRRSGPTAPPPSREAPSPTTAPAR